MLGRRYRIAIGLECPIFVGQKQLGPLSSFRHTGADEIDSVQRGFGDGSFCDPIEPETMVLDGRRESIGQLVHDAHPNLIRAGQRPSFDPGAHLVQFLFRGHQQRLATIRKEAEASAIANLLIALVDVVPSLDLVGVVFVEVFELRRRYSIQVVKRVAIPVQFVRVTRTNLVHDLVPGFSQFGFTKCSQQCFPSLLFFFRDSSADCCIHLVWPFRRGSLQIAPVLIVVGWT